MPRRRPVLVRVLFGIAAVALASIVFVTHVYEDFARVRQRVVREPVAATVEPAVTVVVPEMPALAGQPVALIADIHNTGAGSLALVIRVDGREVGRHEVAAGARRRVDASAAWTSGAHTVAFAADRTGWTLAGLEIANVHGFSSAPIELVVVPAGRRIPSQSVAAVGFVSILLLGLAAWPPPPVGRGAWLFRACAGLAVLILAASLVADRLTSFSILISRQTFVLLVVLLYLRKVVLAAPLVTRAVWSAVKRAAVALWQAYVVRAARRFVVAACREVGPVVPHLIVVGLMLQGVASYWAPGVGFTPLVLFGSQFADRAVPELRELPHAVEADASGYDGQFYAQLAFDPFLRHEHTIDAMDNAAYRGRRMFFPLLAYVIGLGQPAWILQAYAVLNVFAWLALACVLFAWLPPIGARSGRAFAAWVGCLLANGWIASIRLSLTDGPSLLFIALSVLALERAHRMASAGLLGLAILGRETSALSAVALVPRRLSEIRLGHLAALAGAFVPLGLWLVYLQTLGLVDLGGSRNLGAPFVAFWDKWAVTLAELRDNGWWGTWARVSLLCLVGMSVQAVYLAVRWRWSSAWWRIGIAHAVLMVCLGPAVLEGYPGAVTRAVLPLAVAFNVQLMHEGRAFWPLWVLGNLGILTSSDLIQIPYIGSLI